MDENTITPAEQVRQHKQHLYAVAIKAKQRQDQRMESKGGDDKSQDVEGGVEDESEK